VQQIFSSKV